MSVGDLPMKATGRPEASEKVDRMEEIRVREVSTGDDAMVSREPDDVTGTVRCWEGEVEVEDRWGIGSDGGAPHERFELLQKSKSKRRASRRLHRAGRRVFLCFRHSTINLTVRDLEPPTPPKSGPLLLPRSGTLLAPRINGSGVTFMDDAIDHHHHTTTDKSKGLNVEEPTSPVVNCMGQVRSNKTAKHPKKTNSEGKASQGDGVMDRFRSTKSQAPRSSPPRVSKSMSCKWKQLLRSNSSSISPSNHPLCEGEPGIDLGRFSSASGSSDPFYRDHVAGPPHADKKPDKTCLFMQRNNSTSRCNPSDDNHNHNHKRLVVQEQLDVSISGNGGDEGERRNGESEPVFKKLPMLRTNRNESQKWLADEPVFIRLQGLNINKPSRMDSQVITKSSSHS